MWKLDQEEDYFRIYDSKKQIAGYFDPDYGKIFPEENQDKIIERMLKNHEPIHGGFLMLPMVKFGIYDKEELDISSLEQQIDSAKNRIVQWKEFLQNYQSTFHSIHVSHTDQDMLSITLPVKFSTPMALDKKQLESAIAPILDQLQKLHLL